MRRGPDQIWSARQRLCGTKNGRRPRLCSCRPPPEEQRDGRQLLHLDAVCPVRRIGGRLTGGARAPVLLLTDRILVNVEPLRTIWVFYRSLPDEK